MTFAIFGENFCFVICCDVAKAFRFSTSLDRPVMLVCRWCLVNVGEICQIDRDAHAPLCSSDFESWKAPNVRLVLVVTERLFFIQELGLYIYV